MNGGPFHGGVIERLVDMPDIGPIEGRPLWSIQNPVFVEFSTGGMARMKIVRDKIRSPDGNIHGEPRVEASRPFTCRPLALDAEARHLTGGMDAGIGASCPYNRDGLLRQLKQGRLHGFLDRWVIRLALPPGIA